MAGWTTVAVIGALAAFAWTGSMTWVQFSLSSVVAYIALGGHYTIWLLYHTGRRDLTGAYRYLRLTLMMRWVKNSDYCLGDLFERNVTKNPDKVAIIWEGQEWTFKQLSEYSNRVGNSLAGHGLKPGDSIALLMTNRPEYVATWLGASKVGVITALINTNLRQKSLLHCITISKASVIICSRTLQESVSEVLPHLGSGVAVMVADCDSNADITVPGGINLATCIKAAASSIPPQMGSVHFLDRMLYIYTSGTTGLPKAAIISNARYILFCTGLQFMADLCDTDVLYNPLPLYHSAGGMVGMGQTLVFNATAVIRTKFSVSQYWKECTQYGCTIGQYVGEICRYLLNSPPSPYDTQHKVRLMFGNGVRSQIWGKFTRRFNMPVIAEFYGATESNASVMNFEGKEGACGFLTMLCPAVLPVALVKVDEATGALIRGADGLCVRCKPGEIGEFVGKIKRKDPLQDFDGYVDKAASEKKIARNVFSKGDIAFLSGDLLVFDELGYVFFMDRTGDTFRWRGENVSTAEVEGQASLAADNADAVVFGVQVPGAEGKAGMAVVVATLNDPSSSCLATGATPSAVPALDLAKFLGTMKDNLPVYALPLFLRVVTAIDTTGTFKLKKLELQKEGYDMPKLLKADEGEGGHTFFFLDLKKSKYVPLTSGLLLNILAGEAGL
uniref:Very long-chain fatty acid transport protein n=1 Tax=Hirondellea gigas TaxID=1518452 RepID=A0A2P2I1P2_9CRUS